ncbi:hypothetical protein [Streptomyces sp. NPDC055006]
MDEGKAAVIAAVVGVLGALLGAAIGGIAAVRGARVGAKITAREQHELWLRQERKSTYQTLVAALDDYRWKARNLGHAFSEGDASAVSNRLRELHVPAKDLFLAISSMTLLCDREMIAQLDRLLDVIGRMQDPLQRADEPEWEQDLQAVGEEYNQAMSGINRVVGELKSEMNVGLQAAIS